MALAGSRGSAPDRDPGAAPLVRCGAKPHIRGLGGEAPKIPLDHPLRLKYNRISKKAHKEGLPMSITSRPYGVTKAGHQVTEYTLTNKQGASIKAITYGAILTSIIVPDNKGNMADVALGFETLDRYEGDHACMGDTVGRFGNRIALGKFTLEGKEYQLATNNGRNHLHGGIVGFSAKMWEATPVEGREQDSLKFHLVSPDGDENYPGTLDVTVTYTWDDLCNLSIRYEATTDKTTHCNLTNHTYFNLAGHDHGTVRDHVIYIDSDCLTAVDAELIPTGYFAPVAGTPFDLREGRVIGEGLDLIGTSLTMQDAGGYDHNYVLRKGSAMGLCACLYHPESGRSMEVLTDQPAVQFYSACKTDVKGGKNGADYGQYSGLCLETQHFPDAPNQPHFPTTVLKPGERYDTTTIYAFRVEE